MIRHIHLKTPHGTLLGRLDRPDDPRCLILVARSHHVPGDAELAQHLAELGDAVLSMELLTTQELQFADATQNVPRLSQRPIEILDLIRIDGDMENLPLGIFAAGDIAPAAIRAAAQRDAQVKAIACHGGLIDRAGLQALDLLAGPLLMLFDADDDIGPAAYHRAGNHLHGPHEMHWLAAHEDGMVRATTWLCRQVSALK